MDNSYEFYTEKEIEMIDNVKKISGDIMDDDEIYEIMVKHNFIESKVKNEILDIIDKFRKKGEEYEWNIVQNGKEKAEIKKQPNKYTLVKQEKEKYPSYKGSYQDKENNNYYNNNYRKEKRQNWNYYYDKEAKTTNNYKRYYNNDFDIFYQEGIKDEDFNMEENKYIDDKTYAPVDNNQNKKYIKKQGNFEVKEGVKTTTVRRILNDESVEVRIDKKTTTEKTKQPSGLKEEENQIEFLNKDIKEDNSKNDNKSKEKESLPQANSKEKCKVKDKPIINQSLNNQNLEEISNQSRLKDKLITNENRNDAFNGEQDNDSNTQFKIIDNMVMSSLNIDNEIKNTSKIETKVAYQANNNSKEKKFIIPNTNNNNINLIVNKNAMVTNNQSGFENLQKEHQNNSQTEFKGKPKPIVINEFDNIFPPWKSTFHGLKISTAEQLTYIGKGNIVLEWLQSNVQYLQFYKFFLNMQQDQLNYAYNHMNMMSQQDMNNPNIMNNNLNPNPNIITSNNEQGININNMVNMNNNNLNNMQSQGINQMYMNQLGFQQTNQGFMGGNQMNNSYNKNNIPKSNTMFK